MAEGVVDLLALYIALQVIVAFIKLLWLLVAFQFLADLLGAAKSSD